MENQRELHLGMEGGAHGPKDHPSSHDWDSKLDGMERSSAARLEQMLLEAKKLLASDKQKDAVEMLNSMSKQLEALSKPAPKTVTSPTETIESSDDCGPFDEGSHAHTITVSHPAGGGRGSEEELKSAVNTPCSDTDFEESHHSETCIPPSPLSGIVDCNHPELQPVFKFEERECQQAVVAETSQQLHTFDFTDTIINDIDGNNKIETLVFILHIYNPHHFLNFTPPPPLARAPAPFLFGNVAVLGEDECLNELLGAFLTQEEGDLSQNDYCAHSVAPNSNMVPNGSSYKGRYVNIQPMKDM